MRRLPTGTVTFLFTDIEGSTGLLQRLGDAPYAELLAAHHALLRAAFEEGGGHEVSVAGDGFFVAFPNARSAVATAAAVQQTLLSRPHPGGVTLRVRMGLHTGEPIDSAQHAYVGLDVHRAARLCAAGHGGQILLSETTSSLVEHELPEPLHLRDLGTHRLKDLRHSEHVFQLLHPDLPSEFPPLRSLSVLSNNLPVHLTNFVGRARQIAEIEHRLTLTRLLTLIGMGGCGKTRLALQVAANLLPGFADGVWLVELGALSNPALIPQAVLSALRVAEQPRRSPVETLLDYLRPKSLLLVLDNCEHVVDKCAMLVDALLRDCSGLRILATSREALNVPGEFTYQVPPLSCPAPDAPASVESVLESEAGSLFVDRARLVQPGFAATDHNASSIAQVARRLDGIPLAIELAAARVKVLSVNQIAARLTDRFRLLSDGGRTVPSRQRTLRAAMDWSYELLSGQERVLLRRLAVFAGGWALEAAEAICAGEDIEESDVLPLLTQLVDKSLVMAETEQEGARYSLLETMRQYSRDRLSEAAEDAVARRRHRDWYVKLAETAEPACFRTEQSVWYDRLEVEHDNFRDALACSLEDAADGAALRIAGALHWFWYVRGYFTEGRDWLERALAQSPDAPAAARAKALYAAGWLAHCQHDHASATGLAEANYALQRQIGDEKGIAWAFILLGFAAQGRGDYQRARRDFEEGLRLARRVGDTLGISFALNNLGQVASSQGDYGAARAFYEEALPLRRMLGDQLSIAVVLDNLARVAWHQGEYAQAEALFTEALSIRRGLGFKLGIATTLAGLAGVAASRAQPERAARLLGAAGALLSAVGSHLYHADHLEYERTLAILQDALGASGLSALQAEGSAMTLEQIIEYVLTPAI